jgi:hypothetical protein
MMSSRFREVCVPSHTVKRTLVAISFFAFVLAPVSPMFAKTHDYPMRVQVINTHWHSRRGYYYGFGHANLITQQPGQPPKQGMDFDFACGNPVRHTFQPDTYPARYGKNPYEVVVVLPVLGTDKGSECTLKIEMKDYVYQGGRGGALWSLPLGGGQPTQVQEDDGGGDNQ